MRCGGARSRLRRKRTPNEASHWPHTRRLRPALEFWSSEVGAVSRRPDVVLRLQLPPAALPERLAYEVMLSELATQRDRKHQRWKHDQHDQHDQHDLRWKHLSPAAARRPTPAPSPSPHRQTPCRTSPSLFAHHHPFQNSRPCYREGCAQSAVAAYTLAASSDCRGSAPRKTSLQIKPWHMVRQRGG